MKPFLPPSVPYAPSCFPAHAWPLFAPIAITYMHGAYFNFNSLNFKCMSILPTYVIAPCVP